MDGDLESCGTKSKFYQDALTYWSSVEPTVDGMLGGFEYISGTDVNGSTNFLRCLISEENLGIARALDCGAGIGRVTKNLLLPLFETVDMLEVNKKFLDEAPSYIGEKNSGVGEYICLGMQEFEPKHKYDLIWCQWVIGHLTNKHLIEFFERCKNSLAPNGVIAVKDNVTKTQRDYDHTDSSFTRSKDELLMVIRTAGLRVIRREMQADFPPTIFDVPMIACRPEEST